MTGTYYDKNETMQMLGRQSIGNLMEKEAFNKDFHNMIAGHRGEKVDYYDIVVDALLLGFIYGKRVERMRMKGGASNVSN